MTGLRRPSRGAGAAIVLLALSGSRPSGAGRPSPTLPAESTGDVRYLLDVACFDGPGTDNRAEVYIQLANPALRFVDLAGQLTAKVTVELGLADTAGTRVLERKQDLDLFATSEAKSGSWGNVQLLQQAVTLPPGAYRLRAKITDRQARRLGLLDRIIGRRKEGKVDVLVHVPDLGGEGVSLSDLQFARRIAGSTEEPDFAKGSRAVVPNAGRLYGLLLPRLTYYFEVYDPATAPGDTFTISSSILDKDGQLHASRVLRIPSSEPRWGWPSDFDLATTDIGSGRHLLRVVAKNERTGRSSAKGAEFDVIWAMISWGKDPETIVDEVRYVLDPEDLARVETMSPGEREEWLVAFWDANDPTPGTRVNENMEEHYRRVAHANQNWTAYAPGMLSDRGRIYIRYGPPDAIEQGFAGAEFVQEFIETPEGGSLAGTVEGTGRGIEVPGRSQSQDLQDKTYEVWTYETRGHAVTGRKVLKDAARVGMRYLFLDERGYGDLRLVHSSEGEER